MPELRIPDLPSTDLSPGLTLTAPGASVSIAINVADSAYALATSRIAFIRHGVESLENLLVRQSYLSL